MVVLVVLTVAVAFVPRVYVIAVVILDLQVLIGLLVYAVGGAWSRPSWLVRLAHPVFAALAFVATHVGLRGSRRRRGPVAAHRTAAGGSALALLSVLLAVASVSAGSQTA